MAEFTATCHDRCATPGATVCAPTARARRPSLAFATMLLGLVTAAACADDASKGGSDATATEVRCELGTTDLSGTSFLPLAEGGDVELTRGFQGYLLILLRMRCEGAGPRRTGLTIAASRDEGPVRDSVHPGLRWEPAADGSSLSDSFEVWLTPALVPEFIGRTGWVEIAAIDAVDHEICKVRRAVRFVDDDICMHFEDGHLDCSADPDSPAP